VDDLVARLTLAEKISQIEHAAAPIERLGIPAYNWWNECLHGVARAGLATVFPQAIGLAATWNPTLLNRVAGAISDEARAKHHDAVCRGERGIYTGLTFWSPNINMFRDPRWGRGQETYGEDPYLTARLAVAFVRGLQGDDSRYLKLAATAKHFAVHSGPETERHHFDARVSERDLHETYLPAFEACVIEAGVTSVMGAYNRTNGEPCCASKMLLEQTLRREWGLDGYVVSDCWAINDICGGHHVVKTKEEAVALAVANGCDLICGEACPALLQAVKQGLLSESAIDRAVRRLFTIRFRLGMFDPPHDVPYSSIPLERVCCGEHRALALQAARESIVLLKNDGLLPLRKNLASIAVIGPLADDVAALLGNYHGTPPQAITPVAGVRSAVSPETTVYCAEGCDVAPGLPCLHPVSSANLRPDKPDGGTLGLTAEYYANPRFEGRPAFSRTDQAINWFWTKASPLGGQPSDPFAIRWTGWLCPASSGAHRLGVRGSSGYHLLLDGQELLPYQCNEHEPWTRTVELNLEAARLYRLQVEYINQGQDPQVQLVWSVPGHDLLGEALQAAARAEVVILILGLTPALEGEEMPVRVEGFAGGDRTEIALPRTQQALLESVQQLGKPVVLVLLGGSAIAVTWAAEHVPGIVQAWYPGEQGGKAIADVLFGDYNPAGRLPVTVYRSVGDLPLFTDYRMAGRTYRYFSGQPLYPFGHGLSYSRFEYANLRIEPERIALDGETTVSLDITNVGGRAGDEVIQLYVRYPESKVPRPRQELKAFARLALESGGTKSVAFRLAAQQLAYREHGGWRVEPGRVGITLGASSADERLLGELFVCTDDLNIR
jgi:beta-glucosidase